MRVASQSPSRATPKLREASFEDYPQIALLQAEYGMRCGSYEQWQHLWVGNPAYDGRTANGQSGGFCRRVVTSSDIKETFLFAMN